MLNKFRLVVLILFLNSLSVPTLAASKDGSFLSKESAYLRSCKEKVSSLPEATDFKNNDKALDKMCLCIWNNLKRNPPMNASKVSFLIEYNEGKEVIDSTEKDNLTDYQSKAMAMCAPN